MDSGEFKLRYVGLKPDKLQVKRSRWSREERQSRMKRSRWSHEVRLSGELRWKSFGFLHFD